MSNFYRYIVIEGDRWDNIATRFRNNPYDYIDIIENNPSQQGEHILEAGVIISVPVKAPAQVTVTPPWERPENQL